MNPWLDPEPAGWWGNVEDAVAEDLGSGDVTSGCIDPATLAHWRIEAQADGVVCGLGIVEHLLSPMGGDPDRCTFQLFASDGSRVGRSQKVAEGLIPARRALIAERTALNFLMHLSGVATLTANFVEKVEGLARIVDTRKTIPGLRNLQKYAVRCGGGFNHRLGLFDGVMIKDTHIACAGSIQDAVARVSKTAPHTIRIEVECETLDQVREAMNAGADIILLDNMDPFMMREAVQLINKRCLVEASGGVNLDTVRGVAATGVDLISVGSLTHSAVGLPFHMEIE